MLTLIFPAILLLGMIFFVTEYILDAGKWADHYASPYASNGLGYGYVTDRKGEVLLDTTGERLHYSEDLTTRKSTLHLIGDRHGSISAPAVAEYSSHISGFNLVSGLYTMHQEEGQAILTVDADVQNTALKALDGRKGTVAVYNYKTGEILCAVTSPTYDPDDVPNPEDYSDGRYDGMYLNRFTQVTYTPGSIFKAVTTAAALSEIPDIESRTFLCEGSCIIGGSIVKCEGNHGEETIQEALMHSCNCAFAQIAVLLGQENLQKYAEQFGITAPVEFDGITTRKGNFDVSSGEDIDCAWSAIGQSVDLVNPCRYMLFMGQIAGGGTAAEPYLVKTVSSGLLSSYHASTHQTERIMTTEVALRLQEMMHYNVEANYGEYKFPDIGVCAKTGTAEMGGDTTATATFAGFCTSEDYPLAFIAVVEEGGYGRATCIPIMSKVLAACVESMDAEQN